MAEPAREPATVATYADVLAAPAHVVAEVVDGELVLSPRPAYRHAAVETGMARDISENFGRRRGGSGPGGWWILAEPELHLGSAIVVPDVAGWRRERLPFVPDVAYLDLAPDWLCEVTSPRTAGLDRIKKLRVYREAGVAHVWLADPMEQTLEVLRLGPDGYTQVQGWQGDERVRAEPFAAVELDLGEWWGGEPVAPGQGRQQK